jgi:hypothetical protein
VAALAGLAAAWVAAGSIGLLAHPLRRALALLLLGVAVVAQRPICLVRAREGPPLLLTLVAAVCMIALPLATANAMAATIVLMFLAFASSGQRRDIFLATGAAVAAFGLYRFAVTSVPWLWVGADFTGRSLGSAAGLITGRPVRVGATFAGLDFLVLTTAVWGLYLPFTKPPRSARALYGFAGILAGHLLYLLSLAYAPDLLAAVPLPADSAVSPSPIVRFLHQAVPWNLPIAACGLHLLIVAAMFRWSAWAQDDEEHARTGQTVGVRKSAPRLPRAHLAVEAAAIVAAMLLPVVAVLYPHTLSLEGKKIVFYEKGFLNWLKPTHGSYGRLSSGMYGMLGVFIESLGAKALVSADLSVEDLEDADVLVLIFPDSPWEPGQLGRIHDLVRRGGSLLVLGEHTTGDANGNNRFNEVLAPTGLRVVFDSATFAVGGWLHSYEALAHPMTAGIVDEQNQFGIVIGASLTVRWPARPIVIGRWGWSDFGDEASPRAMMGNDRYDPGEKLGDLVLAAEQPLGKGRIVALGDTSGLTNAINVSSYLFTSRLFAYLAGSRTHGGLRQSIALLGTILLAGLLCYRPTPRKTVLVTLGLTVSLAACVRANQMGTALLPDGRRQTPNNLAYIDTSHIAAYSSESWRPDGIGGFALTLMRNGYLTLALPELTPERLERAGLLAVIAPSRSFSRAEVETVKSFVNHGGILIMTVGYDEAGPSEPLLSAFDLWVGLTHDRSLEPEPMGHFKAPYLESESRRVYVRFHAAWPVACDDPAAHVMAYGKGNRPVMVMRRFGTGKALLIGDTCFAMNKNLEWENGASFEGLRENADFWRWLLTVLREQPMWVPPALGGGTAGAAPGRANEEAQP